MVVAFVVMGWLLTTPWGVVVLAVLVGLKAWTAFRTLSV